MQQTNPMTIPEQNEDMPVALRYQLAFFSLTYRYLAWLFAVGLLTTIGLVAALLYAAVSISSTLLIN